MGTITKALGLLELFTVSTPQIGLTEFQKRSGYDKATVYRHLSALAEMGFVEQDQESRNYRLGPAILRLANLRELTFPARDALAPIVDELSANLGELVHASLLHGTTLLSVYHADPLVHGLRVSFDGHEVLPLHASASGLSVLAYCEEATRAEVFSQPLEPLTTKTMTKNSDIEIAVNIVRENGFATASEMVETGVASVAIPIFDRHKKACGGLAVAFPTSRGDAELRRSIISELKDTAPTVTEQLGGVVPDDVTALWS